MDGRISNERCKGNLLEERKLKMKKYIEGILVSGLSAAATGAATAVMQSEGNINLKQIGSVALMGAIIGLCSWIKKSPREK